MIRPTSAQDLLMHFVNCFFVLAQGFSFPIETSSSTPLVVTQTLAHSDTAEETPSSLYSYPAVQQGISTTSSPNRTPTSRPGSLSQDDSLVLVYAVVGTTVIVVSVLAVILILALCFMRKRSGEAVIVTPKALPKAIENEYVTFS